MPSNDVNVVVLEGNIVRDPEVKMIGEMKLASFTMAVNKYASPKKGQTTSYVDIFCFGGQADFVDRYFVKGKRVWIQGELDQDNWKDKTTGENRSKLRVRAHDVNFGYGPMDDKKKFDFTNEDTHEVTPTRAQRAAQKPADPDSEPPF